MLCYKYAAQQMIRQGRGGRLIGACSIAGKRGDPNSAAYCASKFAVRGMSQSAAIDLAPHGINVNCYAPGAIHTEFRECLRVSAWYRGRSADSVRVSGQGG